jgi:predicted acetyltransferase
MSVQIRPLAFADAEESRRLSLEAFGTFPGPLPELTPETWPSPGMQPWGAFDSGRMVAKVVNRIYDSWFGGQRVRTAGIAGVTVVAEHRGGGLLSGLFDAALDLARAEGAAISTLYPTAPGIYRKFGYELAGELLTLRIPLASLATIRPADGILVRRATVEDGPAIRATYDTWATQQNGPLTRRGISFPATDAELMEAFTGITLACSAAGDVLGYAMWNRGPGYDGTGGMDVDDLVAVTPAAASELLRFFGGFSSVVAHLDLETSGLDPALLAIPQNNWIQHRRRQYMLRLLDVPAALSARSWSVDSRVPFSVAGHGLDGSFELEVDHHVGRCSAADASATTAAPHFTSYGLAMLYAGTQSCANLRFAGHLSGSTVHDPTLDALFGGRQFHIRDYF